MAERVQVLLAPEEKARLREQARRDQLSLSMWIRRAALDRLASLAAQSRLRTKAELRAFFKECDRRERGTEPDWDQHLETIERSIRSGDTPP
jgi:hypothetical protein